MWGGREIINGSREEMKGREREWKRKKNFTEEERFYHCLLPQVVDSSDVVVQV